MLCVTVCLAGSEQALHVKNVLEEPQEHGLWCSWKNKFPIGCRVRVEWEDSPKPYYDGVVTAHGRDTDNETMLLRIRYDDKKVLYHSPLDTNIEHARHVERRGVRFLPINGVLEFAIFVTFAKNQADC